MTNTLSSKIGDFDSEKVDNNLLWTEDVKEKTNDFLTELKDKKKIKFAEGRGYIGIWWINKLALKHFGRKIVKGEQLT